MKTITYNNVLYLAAEAAGRVRTNLPAAEAALMRTVVALELKRIWNYGDWNCLIPDPVETTLTSSQFSKNEGAANELGDILGIYTANPRTSTIFEELSWDEGDDVVRVHPLDGYTAAPDTVWVEYMLPCPDLLDTELDAAELADYELPAIFGTALGCRAAAKLLTADGAAGLAGVQFGLADSALTFESGRITRPEYRTRMRVRK